MEFDEEIGYPGLEVQQDIGSSPEPAEQTCAGQPGWPLMPRGQGHVEKMPRVSLWTAAPRGHVALQECCSEQRRGWVVSLAPLRTLVPVPTGGRQHRVWEKGLCVQVCVQTHTCTHGGVQPLPTGCPCSPQVYEKIGEKSQGISFRLSIIHPSVPHGSNLSEATHLTKLCLLVQTVMSTCSNKLLFILGPRISGLVQS